MDVGFLPTKRRCMTVQCSLRRVFVFGCLTFDCSSHVFVSERKQTETPNGNGEWVREGKARFVRSSMFWSSIVKKM